MTTSIGRGLPGRLSASVASMDRAESSYGQPRRRQVNKPGLSGDTQVDTGARITPRTSGGNRLRRCLCVRARLGSADLQEADAAVKHDVHLPPVHTEGGVGGEDEIATFREVGVKRASPRDSLGQGHPGGVVGGVTDVHDRDDPMPKREDQIVEPWFVEARSSLCARVVEDLRPTQPSVGGQRVAREDRGDRSVVRRHVLATTPERPSCHRPVDFAADRETEPGQVEWPWWCGRSGSSWGARIEERACSWSSQEWDGHFRMSGWLLPRGRPREGRHPHRPNAVVAGVDDELP
jgi:hypothetical protein